MKSTVGSGLMLSEVTFLLGSFWLGIGEAGGVDLSIIFLLEVDATVDDVSSTAAAPYVET